MYDVEWIFGRDRCDVDYDVILWSLLFGEIVEWKKWGFCLCRWLRRLGSRNRNRFSWFCWKGFIGGVLMGIGLGLDVVSFGG